jgi:hypothetical protein
LIGAIGFISFAFRGIYEVDVHANEKAYDCACGA